MKKIALMTWHHVNNYGTAFQALALKELITEFDCDVDIINYMRLEASPIQKKSLKKIIKNLFYETTSVDTNGKIYEFNDDCFEAFYSKNFTYTQICHSRQDLQKLNNIYNGFVCGSDQIWGPRWFDSHYFLDFVTDSKRKIAYAPSIGVTGLSSFQAAWSMKKLISKIKYLSVREKTGCDEISELTGRHDVINVLDPVLLIDGTFWEKILATSKQELPKNDYMFIFFLKNNEEYIQFAIEEAKKKNLKPIIMHSTQSIDNNYYNIEAPKPEDLLKYLKEAKYICTDSFHIMVFSIIFNKQFTVFNKHNSKEFSSQNGRLTELLDRLKIKNVVYNGKIGDKIDYRIVNDELYNLKRLSKYFLENAIKNIPDEINYYDYKNTCEDCKKCKGNISFEMKKYFSKRKFIEHKFIKKRMMLWNFSLEGKCYGCEKNENINTRKPIFYDELLNDFLKNKSLLNIYMKYYFTYDLINVIKKMIQFVRR